MKRSTLAFAVLLIRGATTLPVARSAIAQEKPAEKHYEMTTYYVALLYRGPNSAARNTPERRNAFEGHMANIRKMAADGKLLLAGPFSDDGNLQGMFVFQVGSLDEAKALAANDPAVKAGYLAAEVHPWYSARGIKVDQ